MKNNFHKSLPKIIQRQQGEGVLSFLYHALFIHACGGHEGKIGAGIATLTFI